MWLVRLHGFTLLGYTPVAYQSCHASSIRSIPHTIIIISSQLPRMAQEKRQLLMSFLSSLIATLLLKVGGNSKAYTTNFLTIFVPEIFTVLMLRISLKFRALLM